MFGVAPPFPLVQVPSVPLLVSHPFPFLFFQLLCLYNCHPFLCFLIPLFFLHIPLSSLFPNSYCSTPFLPLFHCFPYVLIPPVSFSPTPLSTIFHSPIQTVLPSLHHLF